MTTVVLSSGADPKFTKGWTKSIQNYLESSPKWDEIANTGNAQTLLPGDVFVVHNNGVGGHTFIYLGDGQAAQARLGWAVGYAFDINKVRPKSNDDSWQQSMAGRIAMDGQLMDGIWKAYDMPYKIFRAHY